MKTSEYQVTGNSKLALFTLKLHRGEGMTLLAMNWKTGKPSTDFVGFAIEYKEPGGKDFFALKNRLSFAHSEQTDNRLSTLLSPIQKFRWVHFPRNANLDGLFEYRVTPVFMNKNGELNYGKPQKASIALQRETFPGKLNVSFTRGFVSSQAFVDYYESAGAVANLLPSKAKEGLDFEPTHPKAKQALEWMGFEARQNILNLLDKAIADKSAKVYVIAYDLNEPEIVTRLLKLKKRLKIIIDDDGSHGEADAAETTAAARLSQTAGTANVKRQHMGKLQHNKTIIVNGSTVQTAIAGSTNFSWRGLYVQANNAVLVHGAIAIQPFLDAFTNFWNNDTVAGFGSTPSAQFKSLGLKNIDASICFSPHTASNAVLATIANDIENNTTSSLFYSLAFLYQTKGTIKDAITKITQNTNRFVYGISDKKVGGLDLQKPDGNLAAVYATALSKNLPEPFKTEPTGGGGTRMHHKFVVIDFDKPTARVYLGSYNFSVAADTQNGENLLLIKDRKVATAYLIEALRIFDHYHFRVAQQEAKKSNTKLALQKPPDNASAKPWFNEYYTNKVKIKDRELFA